MLIFGIPVSLRLNLRTCRCRYATQPWHAIITLLRISARVGEDMPIPIALRKADFRPFSARAGEEDGANGAKSHTSPPISAHAGEKVMTAVRDIE